MPLTSLQMKELTHAKLLVKIMEEGGEVIQATAKVYEFGPQQHHPQRTSSNIEELIMEHEQQRALIIELCGRVGITYGMAMDEATRRREGGD